MTTTLPDPYWNSPEMRGWYTPEVRELCKAFAQLETADSVARFLRDLLTQEELKECSSRWRAVQLLAKGLSYREVSKLTGLSTATVTRIAKWKKQGTGGYQLVIERQQRKNRSSADHPTSPDTAEHPTGPDTAS